jgi:3-dehydroquinate synthase
LSTAVPNLPFPTVALVQTIEKLFMPSLSATSTSSADAFPVTVQVALGERSYPIYIGRDFAASLPKWLRECCGNSRHAVVISDAKIGRFADRYCDALLRSEYRVTKLTVPSGEGSKSLAEASRLWDAMLAEHTDRGSMVIAIGGGVVGDLAGFVAATFTRGLPLVQIPTTLLSHVDSSVGGKTGVNLPQAKNMVGAFWQPSVVVIDTDSLESLPQREFVSGLAEVLKYGVILIPELLDYLEQNASAVLSKDPAAIAHIVAESCRAKALVVQQDERETTGLRAILNYGHTFAHALESVVGYGQLLHGEAVAIGMHMAACLAHQLGRVSLSFVERQRQLLKALQLPTQFTCAPPEKLWLAMQHDKKVEHGRLRFVLPTRFGHVEMVPGITQEQTLKAIAVANKITESP